MADRFSRRINLSVEDGFLERYMILQIEGTNIIKLEKKTNKKN